MKKPKEDLFELIQSLTPSEKRYFKVNSPHGSERKNYMKIFEEINKYETYDEERLRKKFKGEKVLRNLAKEKQYLYKAILRSIRLFRLETSVDAQVRELILNAHFLQERGLYDQAKQHLTKAKELAKKYEKFPAILEILDLESNLVLICIWKYIGMYILLF